LVWCVVVAMARARPHNGEVVAVSVVEVPEGEALATGQHHVEALEPVLEQAVAYAQERGVRARPVVEIARRVSHGIVEAAREEECNFLVIGQPVAHSVVERIVASIVERVLQDAPSQVGIVFGTVRPEQVKQIVVPVTKGANPQLAAELAPALGQWFDAPVRAVTVVPHDASEEEAEKQVAEARATLAEAKFAAEPEVLRRREVGRGLAQSLRRDDLVLIGAPSAGPVAAILGETVPTEIAARRRVPVVVVRDVEERKARRFESVFFGRGS
jgi:nucleotide-binding universal stress UspA family protein